MYLLYLVSDFSQKFVLILELFIQNVYGIMQEFNLLYTFFDLNTHIVVISTYK